MPSQSSRHSEFSDRNKNSDVQSTDSHITPPVSLVGADRAYSPTTSGSPPSFQATAKAHPWGFTPPKEDTAFLLYHDWVYFDDPDSENSDKGTGRFYDPDEAGKMGDMLTDYQEHVRALDVLGTVREKRPEYRRQRCSEATCDKAEQKAKLKNDKARERFDASYQATVSECRISEIKRHFTRLDSAVPTQEDNQAVISEAEAYYASAKEETQREKQHERFLARPRWKV
jgi:hypothetical protein